MRERIDLIADLLLGAAYSDEHLHDREKDKIRHLLGEIAGDADLPRSVYEQIDTFDPRAFELASCAQGFLDDSTENKRRLIELVAAVHEADEELDLAEDEYLRDLARAIGLNTEALGGLTLEYEVEDLKQSLAVLRASPPPIPDTSESS
jgi:uncharacterized tellurite resistance protein B-like protein